MEPHSLTNSYVSFILCIRTFILDLSSGDESNYSSSMRAAKAKKAAERSARGDRSSLPLSSPPGGLDSDEPEEDESPSPNRKRKITAVKNNNISGRDGGEIPASKKPGVLSSEALEEIRVFSDEVKSKAEQLG